MNRAQNIVRRGLVIVSGILALVAVSAPSASANLEFAGVGVSVDGSDGQFARQAGGHSDISFTFSVKETDGVESVPLESVRDVELELPPGLIGNATRFPTCSMDQLTGSTTGNLQQCPVSSQVGKVTAFIASTGGTVPLEQPTLLGLFNIAHGPEVPAKFAFNYLGYVATIVPQVRPGDHGISAGSTEISRGITSVGASVEFWAYPADPSHDGERQGAGLPFIIEGLEFPSTAPNLPFTSNPTSCPERGSSFTARGDSWENPGVFDTRQLTADEDGVPFLWEGCEKLPFAPKAELAPESGRAHSPTGLGVRVELPQNEGSNGLSTSAAKQVALTLPEGMAISPSVAAGQSGCTSAQVDLESNDPPACPASSRLGTIELKTPLLEQTLKGEFVLAAQNDNPFNATYAVYMLIDGPGFWLKLPGELQVDRQTGQLRTVFDELPQLPFESVDVQLDGGPNAPLSNPGACGTYTARSEITPWARPDEPVVQNLPMQINERCDAAGFNPGMKGGTLNPTAGKRSPFVVQISRQDGEQNLSRIDVTLPEGQLASLKGVAECPEAQASSGNCPASSQIGAATGAVGVGSSPLQVPQPGKAPTALFLGGPYKGAPLSLVALVPAQAGAFDLGNVVVRTALQVDPTTAQVTAKSDPLPQIVEGVPLQYRDLRIELTRPDFGVNPTSCERMAITSTLTSVSGTEAHPSVPYEVNDCASLGFKPKLALKFSGDTNRSAHPALKATLAMPKGGANIAKAVVLLPETEFIDNAHITNPCTRVQFDAGNCPKSSILGTAKAYTPLLDQPLTGPVYFRSNGGDRELPDLIADLKGQIRVTLVGFIDTVKTGKETARVRTRFLGVPDAPVSKFVLSMKGGDKGLIVNNTELCREKPRAKVQLAGQNGKRSVSNPLIKLGCK
jgi:hypothetical protein